MASVPTDDPDSPKSPPASRPSLTKRASETSPSTTYSPMRHHHRTVSAPRTVKETHNARAEYSTSQDDGASQRRINQYLIQEEIGRGSFGAVHFATDQFGKEYAVKEFSKSRLRKRAKSNLLRQARQQNRLRQGRPSPGIQLSDQQSSTDQDNSFNLIKEEIAIMKKLNHENLVSLIEVLDDPEEDSLYMVLEMCRKGVVMKIEMDEQVEPKDDETARHLFRDLILGIEYLHSQGVVHRDIKPDNCLLTIDDTLKVVDFGVSEMFEKTEEMKIAKSAGSPAFMAPELCEVRKEGVHGRPADIWSMGITLYCLKFGRVPFQKHSVLELYESIVKDPISIDPDCDPNLANLLNRLLEKDPDTRITMEELREHPWVTRDGVDTLLSAEDNCAAPLAPPTEEEKETAITNNMGGLIAVLKAANKLKSTVHHKHPEIMESILNRASQIVQPPHPISYHQSYSDLKNDFRNLFRSSRNKDQSDEVPEQAIATSGIYREADVTSELGRMREQFKQALFQGSRHKTVDARMQSDDAPEGAKELSQFRQEHDDEEAKHRRHSFEEFDNPHSHEPFDEHLYLNIGQGPHEGTESPDGYVVSESPPATDFSVFEQAYNEEVANIRHSGRNSTIFLTRRVEKRINAVWERIQDSSRTAAESSPPGSRRARVADFVGKAWQRPDQRHQNAGDDGSG